MGTGKKKASFSGTNNVSAASKRNRKDSGEVPHKHVRAATSKSNEQSRTTSPDHTLRHMSVQISHTTLAAAADKFIEVQTKKIMAEVIMAAVVEVSGDRLGLKPENRRNIDYTAEEDDLNLSRSKTKLPRKSGTKPARLLDITGHSPPTRSNMSETIEEDERKIQFLSDEEEDLNRVRGKKLVRRGTQMPPHQNFDDDDDDSDDSEEDIRSRKVEFKANEDGDPDLARGKKIVRRGTAFSSALSSQLLDDDDDDDDESDDDVPSRKVEFLDDEEEDLALHTGKTKMRRGTAFSAPSMQHFDDDDDDDDDEAESLISDTENDLGRYSIQLVAGKISESVVASALAAFTGLQDYDNKAHKGTPKKYNLTFDDDDKGKTLKEQSYHRHGSVYVSEEQARKRKLDDAVIKQIAVQITENAINAASIKALKRINQESDVSRFSHESDEHTVHFLDADDPGKLIKRRSTGYFTDPSEFGIDNDGDPLLHWEAEEKGKLVERRSTTFFSGSSEFGWFDAEDPSLRWLETPEHKNKLVERRSTTYVSDSSQLGLDEVHFDDVESTPSRSPRRGTKYVRPNLDIDSDDTDEEVLDIEQIKKISMQMVENAVNSAITRNNRLTKLDPRSERHQFPIKDPLPPIGQTKSPDRKESLVHEVSTPYCFTRHGSEENCFENTHYINELNPVMSKKRILPQIVGLKPEDMTKFWGPTKAQFSDLKPVSMNREIEKPAPFQCHSTRETYTCYPTLKCSLPKKKMNQQGVTSVDEDLRAITRARMFQTMVCPPKHNIKNKDLQVNTFYKLHKYYNATDCNDIKTWVAVEDKTRRGSTALSALAELRSRRLSYRSSIHSLR